MTEKLSLYNKVRENERKRSFSLLFSCNMSKKKELRDEKCLPHRKNRGIVDTLPSTKGGLA